MTTISNIQSSDSISGSRTAINNNFTNLNNDKIETSVIDTDTTLSANSDSKIPSQKAVKAYVDAGGNPNASTTQKGIVEEATQAELTAGTTTGSTGARLFINPVHTVSTSTGASDEGKIPRLNSSGKVDATLMPFSYLKTAVRSSGTFTRSSRAASGTVNIPHGLGIIPTKVKFTGFCINNNDTGSLSGVFDSSGQRCLTILDAEGGTTGQASGLNNASSNAIFIPSANVNMAEYNACVVSVDATNIICSWTFNDNSYSAITWTILWEAEGNTV